MKIPNDYTEDSNSFTPIEPGDYQAIVEKCQLTTSKSGKGMYAVTLGIAGTRRKLFDYMITDEGHLLDHNFALQKLLSFLKACGFYVSAKAGDDVDFPTGQTFEAKEIWVNVAIDKNDSTKNVIFRYFGSKPEGRKPSATKAYTQSVQQRAANTEAPNRTKMNDEDVPF